ncbi:PilT protein domain protein [uncultured Desulfobacterium sp.]|uniref:PilT protein domain protein n=1 Tax=uncultured Desulfobacterium sp. TaxID=201089 RepID=A0A445MZ47_9BACT|nr:PilT protein domain protein [uncultured Desulfobacterium sp.]
MKLLVDSSAFAKRYVQEYGSEEIEGFLQRASELALCIILLPEIVSGLNRRLREQILSPNDYRKVKNRLLEDVSDATVIQITPAVISHSVKLLENNVLRAMDSFHVACALEWHADIFVTADIRQLTAARNAGLQTEFIGRQTA